MPAGSGAGRSSGRCRRRTPRPRPRRAGRRTAARCGSRPDAGCATTVGRIGPQPVLEGEGDRAAVARRDTRPSPCCRAALRRRTRRRSRGARAPSGPARSRPEARHLAHVGQPAATVSRGLGRAHHGARIGMPAGGGERMPRAARTSSLTCCARRQRRFAQRQRAGLVEHDRVDLGQSLQPVGGLDEHALAEQPAGGGHLHGRHGQRQRAGTGDDQHGDGGRQRRLPAVAGGEPAEEGGEPQDVHGRRIEARGAVGEPHVAAARLLGGRHQPGDLGEQGVLVGGGGLA